MNNLFEKIFEIMNEYENLLNNKISSEKEKNNFFFEEDFFKFIFENIKISKKNEDITEININDNNNDIIREKYLNNNNNYINDSIKEKYLNNNKLIENNKSKIDNTNIDNTNIINQFIKKIYKKIILKCHPDKNGNSDIFIKCQEYYQNNFLIGILYIAYKIKFELPILNEKIIAHIFYEIRIIQDKIQTIKNNI